jgi:CAF1 family ribonuclease
MFLRSFSKSNLLCKSFSSYSSKQIMEVTASNFHQVLPQLCNDISRASFISFDTELSGLDRESWITSLSCDTIDSRWAKTRDSALSFGILQFGICPFHIENDRFVGRPYSFYIHPRESRLGLDAKSGQHGVGGATSLTFSTSAMTFLSNNKFDFNSAIANGITFLSHEGEEILRKDSKQNLLLKLQRRYQEIESNSEFIRMDIVIGNPIVGNDRPSNTLYLSRKEDIDWYNSLLSSLSQFRNQIKNWISSGSNAEDESMPFEVYSSNSNSSDASLLKFPYFTFPPANGFRRKVIYSLIANDFDNSSFVVHSFSNDQVSDNPWDKVLRLTYIGAGTAGKKEWLLGEYRRQFDEINQEIDLEIGFRKVIDAISKAKIPIVGHNCQLDLAHMIAKFVGTPSINVCDWALQLANIFPFIYDTKHILTMQQSNSVAQMLLSSVFNNNNGLGQAFLASSSIQNVYVDYSMITNASKAAVTSEPPVVANTREERVSVSVNFPSLINIQVEDGFNKYSPETENPKELSMEIDEETSRPASESLPPLLVHSSKAHDAGADALMTGVVFLRSIALLHSGIDFVDTTVVPVDDASKNFRVRKSFKVNATPLPALKIIDFIQKPTSSQLMSSLVNKLHQMRVVDPYHRVLDISDASELARHGKSSTSFASKENPGDGVNSIIVARKSVDRSRYLYISNLNRSVSTEGLQTMVCNDLGMNLNVIDKRRDIIWIDSYSAFVILPSPIHVALAVEASQASSIDTSIVSTEYDENEDDESESESEEVSAEVKTEKSWLEEFVSFTSTSGANMLGVPGIIHDKPFSSSEKSSKRRKIEIETSSSTNEEEDLERIIQTVKPHSLKNFLVLSYGEFLQRHRHVFHDTCDHEVTAKVSAIKPSTATPIASKLNEHDSKGSCVVS